MKLPMYDYKFWAEVGWAAIVTGLVFVLTAVAMSQGVTDWKAWAVSVGAGAIRAVAGAILSKIVPQPGAGA